MYIVPCWLVPQTQSHSAHFKAHQYNWVRRPTGSDTLLFPEFSVVHWETWVLIGMGVLPVYCLEHCWIMSLDVLYCATHAFHMNATVSGMISYSVT